MLMGAKKFGGISVAGVKQQESRNRGEQLVVVAAMLVTGFGAVLAYGGSLVGYVILPLGLITLIVSFKRALKNWDY